MAVRKVGARVELDGEREYKQALNELNTGNATLRTEMQKLQAEYQGSAESTEYLTKRSELLERQLLQQQDKVETLRKAVSNAAQQYGEADSRTQKWVQQLNKAEAEEFKLRAEIEETNTDLEVQGNVMNSLVDGIGNLTDSFGVQLPAGADKALNAMRGFSNGSVAAIGLVAAAIAAAIEGMKALTENAIKYAAEADEILSQSMVTGLSTTLLQELQYAEPLIDVSVETITGSLTKLTQNMASAEGGNDALKEKFEELGVSITDADGHLRSAQDVFFDAIDALGQIGNDTERDAAAMALLGKSAQDLNPLIKQGTAALQEYIEAADENYVLTEEQIEALAGLDDAVAKNELQWDALKRQIAAQFAPAATTALENFGKLVRAAGDTLVDSKIIEGVGEILEMLSAMLSPLTNLLSTADGAPNRLRPVYEILHGIAGVIAWIADAADVVVGLLSLDFNRIGTALGYGAKSGNYSNMQKWMGMGDMTGNYYDPETGLYYGNYGRNAGGTDSWRGGLTWVGEAGPELVALPSGSQVYNAQDSRNMGGNTFYITIDAKNVQEFNDVVDIVMNASTQLQKR